MIADRVSKYLWCFGDRLVLVVFTVSGVGSTGVVAAGANVVVTTDTADRT